MSNIELIKELSDAFGPSGFEDEVSEIVKREMKDFKNLEEDSLRNVRCELKQNSGKYTVMLDSHLDEVGVIVQAIKPNGTMNFLTLGRWAETSLPKWMYTLLNAKGQEKPLPVRKTRIRCLTSEMKTKKMKHLISEMKTKRRRLLLPHRIFTTR